MQSFCTLDWPLLSKAAKQSWPIHPPPDLVHWLFKHVQPMLMHV